MQRMLEDLRARGSTGATRAGFSVTVVATLALGIGVASAAISLLHALVLRPLDVSDPKGSSPSLVDRRGRASQIPLPTSLEIARRESFESVSAYTGGGLIQTEIDGRGVVMRTIEAVTPRHLRDAGREAHPRPVVFERRHRQCRGRAGDRHQPRGLAAGVQRPHGGDWANDPGPGSAAHDHRRHPSELRRPARRNRAGAGRDDAHAPASSAAGRSPGACAIRTSSPG